jgi:hypothetical protein
MCPTQEYSLTVRDVFHNLLMLADAYERASAASSPAGFIFNPTVAAANMRAAVHFIAQLPVWIPVGERLPERNEVVCVLCGATVTVGSYSPMMHDWWAVVSPAAGMEPTRSVSHWMPLPEPPVIPEAN